MYAAGPSLHGTVTAGPNKTQIANARVFLQEGGLEQRTFSDADGRYEFISLDQARSYTLIVESDGLKTFAQEQIIVANGESRQIDVNLALADLRSTVLVTQGAIHLEAVSAEVSQTIDSTEVKELPSVTRSPAKYALLDPHVLQPLGLGADYQDANRLSINGASYRHTSYMLDGTTNYDWVYANSPQTVVSVASVDDVKVMPGDYSAQYGNSTSGIIAITTASGTDVHHGELFAYVRPSGIQASPALATFHIPNQKLDWGMLAGGPVMGAHSHYFGSYERIQQSRGAFITSPTASFFNGQSNEYSGLIKLDHEITPTNDLSMRLNGNHYATDNGNDRIAGINNASYGRTQRIQSWGGQVSDQAAIGNKVNVARFAYTNYVPDSARPLESSAGVVVPNYLQAGNSTYSWVHAQSETASELLAFSHGRSDVKFGGEFEHLHVRDYSYSADGTYYYNTAADFLHQNPYKFLQTYGAADVKYGQQELSAFAQFDLRLTRRFTATAGARYEVQSITDSRHNIGPRVGLAWDATGDGKTIVRVGGGVFFDQYYMYLTRRFIVLGPHSPQFNYTWDCTAVPNPCPVYPNSVESPASGIQSPSVSYLYIPANKLLNPYSLQFSAAVERQIAPNTVLTLDGLQVHTLQQMRVNDINHPAPFVRTAAGQTRSTAAANATRPFTTYDGVHNVTLIDQIENKASSIYQSLDVSLKSHVGRWGEAEAHYVLAGSYAYAMFYADYNSGVPSEWLPGWDKCERGPSDFYERNHLISDAVLHGPYQTSLSFVGNFGSGLPVNPITGLDNNGDGYNVDRPVGLGRDSFRTPSQMTVDTAIAKNISLRERLHAEIRVDALNVLNSKNFISVNNTYGNGAAPTSTFLAPKAGIGNTDPSRQLQFVLRLQF
jgi:hypothetical protein